MDSVGYSSTEHNSAVPGAPERPRQRRRSSLDQASDLFKALHGSHPSVTEDVFDSVRNSFAWRQYQRESLKRNKEEELTERLSRRIGAVGLGSGRLSTRLSHDAIHGHDAHHARPSWEEARHRMSGEHSQRSRASGMDSMRNSPAGPWPVSSSRPRTAEAVDSTQPWNAHAPHQQLHQQHHLQQLPAQQQQLQHLPPQQQHQPQQSSGLQGRRFLKQDAWLISMAAEHRASAAHMPGIQEGASFQHPPEALEAGPGSNNAPQPASVDAEAPLQTGSAVVPAAAAAAAAAAVAPEGGGMDPSLAFQEEHDMTQYSALQQRCIRLCNHPDFEFVVTLVIFLNCISLSLFDPLQPEGSQWNATLSWIELVLNVFYTLEMLVRILAMGSVLDYLKQPWNMFDSFMVAAGYISLLPVGGNTSGMRALRALRALRPLRTIARFESLRAVVVCFLEAVPLMGACAVIVLALLLLYAVASVQMFTNAFHNICVNDINGSFENDGDDPDMFGCSGPTPSGWWYRQCPANYTCADERQSTAVNVAGFDNTGLALLTNWQVLTLTGWTFVMFRTMDNTSPFACIYFITLVVVGAYCVMNLFLAVLKTKFAKAQSVYHAHSAPHGGHKNTLSKLVAGLQAKMKQVRFNRIQKSRLARKLAILAEEREAAAANASGTLPADYFKPPTPRQALGGSGAASTAASRAVAPVVIDSMYTPIASKQDATAAAAGQLLGQSLANRPAAAAAAAFGTAVPPRVPRGVKFMVGGAADGRSGASPEQPPNDTLQSCQPNEDGNAVAGKMASSDLTVGGDKPDVPPSGAATAAAGNASATFLILDTMKVQEFDAFVQEFPGYHRAWLRFQFRMRKIVNDNRFTQFFLICIFINTLLLALDYDGISDAESNALWDFNIVLSALFTMELILKLIGLGMWEYCQDSFNIFDVIVVVVSLLEIIMASVSGLNALRSLRVLRALRVLRLFKMFKYVNSLRKIGEVLVSSFSSFFAIMVLLCLFWLVFTIMGMHVFGGYSLEPVPWPNFDTFLNSMVSTFNIMDLENYQNQLYAVVSVTNYGAAVYYVVWIIIGKYICTHLFLAVMLEAFEAKYDHSGGTGGSFVGSFVTRMGSMMRSFTNRVSSFTGSFKGSGARRLADAAPPTIEAAMADKPPASAAAAATAAAAAALGTPRTAAAGAGAVQPPAPHAPLLVLRSQSTRKGAHIDVDTPQQALDNALDVEGTLGTETFLHSKDTSGKAPLPVARLNVAAVLQAAPDPRQQPEIDSAESHQGHIVRSGAGRCSSSGAIQDLGVGNPNPNLTFDPQFPGSQTQTRALQGQSSSRGGVAGPVAEAVESSPRPQDRRSAVGTSGGSFGASPWPPTGSLHTTPRRLPDPSIQYLTNPLAMPSQQAEVGQDGTEDEMLMLQPLDLHRQQSTSITPAPAAAPAASTGTPPASARRMAEAAFLIEKGIHGGPSLPYTSQPQPSATPGGRSTVDPDLISLHGTPFGIHGADLDEPDEAGAEAQNASSHTNEMFWSVGSRNNSSSSGKLVGRTNSAASTVQQESRHLNGARAPAPPPVKQASHLNTASPRMIAVSPSHPPSPAHQSSFSASSKSCNPIASFHDSSNSFAQHLLSKISPSMGHGDNAATTTPGTDNNAHDLAMAAANNETSLSQQQQQHGTPAAGDGLDRLLTKLLTSPRPPASPTCQSHNSSRRIATPPSGDSRMVSSGAGNALQQSQSGNSAKPPEAVPQAGPDRLAGLMQGLLEEPGQGLLLMLPGKAQQTAPVAQAGGSGRTSATGNNADLDAVMDIRRVSDADKGKEGMVRRKSSDLLSHHSTGTFSSQDSGRLRHHPISAEERFRMRQAQRNGAIPIEGSGQSFWLFDEDHPVRVAVYDTITHKYFDYIMFAIILLNCIGMAIENPRIQRDSTLGELLYWSDVCFTVVFGIEVLVKAFAFTFNCYIREITNQVDFAIVVVSVLVLALEAIASNVSAVKGLRALRAIKPLRMLTRSAGMRMVFKSVMLSMAAMANVSIVLVMFFLIFAILGTQLFMGLLWSCNDDSVENVTQCTGEFTPPGSDMPVPRVWQNAWPNFDNVGNSLMVCFLVASLNGYTQVMQQAMSAPKNKGDQPKWMDNPGAFFWFMGFVFVVGFSLLNLYVGVIFSQFSKIRLLNLGGSAFLTSQQQEWAELSKMVFKLKPIEKGTKRKNKFQQVVNVIVMNNVFESIMMVIIVFNVIVLACAHYGQTDATSTLFERFNYFFVACYCTEAIAKILAVGWRCYWQDSWNKFDFALAILAIIDIGISSLHTSFVRALRVLRAQKLLRLLHSPKLAHVTKGMSNIKVLCSCLVGAIPGFGNVSALIALVLFMYSYVGVFLFADIHFHQGINEHVNFNNFLNALLVLIRVATLDNWVDILQDCIQKPGETGCSKEEGNCGSYIAIPFFMSYIVIVSVILLNLFTAVVVELFEKTHEQEEWKLSPEALQDFVALWSEYDDSSGTITPRDLEALLMRLEPPLGLGAGANPKAVLQFVYDLDIPLVNGRVPFHKTAFELVKRVSHSNIVEGAMKQQLDKLVNKHFKHLNTDGEILQFSTAIAVLRIQRLWRAHTQAAKLNAKKACRTKRVSNINYTLLVQNQAHIAYKYRQHKQEERDVAEEQGRQGWLSRWKFNPKYTPLATEFEREADTAGWKGLMGFASVKRVSKTQ